MIPIYIPDDELYLKLGKMLLLVELLSLSRKDEPILTLEKVALFDFLITHPFLLNKVLEAKNKKTIQLDSSERYSIEAIFPNKGLLFDFSKIKILLNILIGYKFVTVSIEKDYDVNYLITNEGKSFTAELSSQYFLRIKEMLENFTSIKSLSYNVINQLFEPYLRYGIKN